MPKYLTHRKRERALWGVLFVLPCFLIIFLFVIYPLFRTLYLSFCEYNFAFDLKPTFSGISNYLKMFQDQKFRIAFRNTSVFAVIDFTLMMVISLAIALMLYVYGSKGSWFFRTSVFIPIVVPVSLACILFSWMFAENFGLVNQFLIKVGLSRWAQPWLTSSKTALGTLIVVNIWCNIGFEVILFLSGLQAIPQEVLEAAVVDGATGWRRLVYIILPLLRETYVITGIWAIIAALKVFVEPMVMTIGGPGTSTLVLYMYIYDNAFKYFNMGYASSMAFILSSMILVFSLLNMKLSHRED